jgi:hypothetical protein
MSDGDGEAMVAASNLAALMVNIRVAKMTEWSEERQMRQIAAYFDWALQVVRERSEPGETL